MSKASEERISVAEALVRVLERVDTVGSEPLAVRHALGRVLAQDVISDIDVSPFDNTAMDGYGIHASDIEAASADNPVVLEVVAEEGAGHVFEGVVESGQAVRIMTGAPIPAGVDSVVKYEIVEVLEGDGGTSSRVSFSQPCKLGANIRKAGEEFKAGDLVLKTGTTVNPYAMGLIASAGMINVEVYRKPKVGLFCIGSELVSAPAVPVPGKIRDCNMLCLTGLAQDAGAEVIPYGIVDDDMDDIKAKINQALEECDIVVTAGGASTGDFDFINRVICEMGEEVFSYLSLRPGKRQTFGIINGKPVFGLSGNPAAAAVGFELLIRPALRKMQGFTNLTRTMVKARLEQPIKKKEGRAFYQRGLVWRAEDGSWAAREYGTQSSALLGDLEKCNCLIVVPEDSMSPAEGDEIMCMRIDIPEGSQS